MTQHAAGEGPPPHVVILDEHDDDGSRSLWAYLLEDGRILVNGHDAGPGVERILGCPDYEWDYSISADAIGAMVRALGGADGDDPLLVLQRWGREHRTDPFGRLKDAGVPLVWEWCRRGF